MKKIKISIFIVASLLNITCDAQTAGPINSWKPGIEYTYYSDGSCTPGQGKICLTDSKAYEMACKSVKGGITDHLFDRLVGAYGSSSLFKNGTITGARVYWNGIICVADITASGIVNGNSSRQTASGKVVSFVVNSKKQIAAYGGY